MKENNRDDYFLQGYNGFWDAYWTHAAQAIKELDIENDRRAKASFLRGWNTASSEQSLESKTHKE